ncbi:hypothetical protein HK097_004849, partial [Rhizophlyctis rosea]
FVPPITIPHIRSHPSVFVINPSETRVDVHPNLKTESERTHAVEGVMQSWRDKGLFDCLKGWRSECYDVFGSLADGKRGVIMQIERSAAGCLGIRAYGCHLNGYTRDAQTGELKMWIARRSKTKQTYPGMLDNIVGGGLPAGVKPHQNILKESQEEASIPPSLASKAIPVSAATFFMNSPERGWIPDTEYIYDLELPSDFVPKPEDGEVEGFYLMSVDEIKKHLHANEFMPESGLVVIDFLIRHGFVSAKDEPDYVDVLQGLRRKLPFPGPSFCWT